MESPLKKYGQLTKTIAEVTIGKKRVKIVVVHNLKETFENNLENALDEWCKTATRASPEKFTKYLRKRFPESIFMSEKECKRKIVQLQNERDRLPNQKRN